MKIKHLAALIELANSHNSQVVFEESENLSFNFDDQGNLHIYAVSEDSLEEGEKFLEKRLREFGSKSLLFKK